MASSFSSDGMVMFYIRTSSFITLSQLKLFLAFEVYYQRFTGAVDRVFFLFIFAAVQLHEVFVTAVNANIEYAAKVQLVKVTKVVVSSFFASCYVVMVATVVRLV